MFMIVNLMGYQNTTFFMMANILNRERDLGEINSVGVKLQYFSALVCVLGCKMTLIFFFACIAII